MLLVSTAVENLYDTLHDLLTVAGCLSGKSDKFLLEFYFGYMT